VISAISSARSVTVFGRQRLGRDPVVVVQLVADVVELVGVPRNAGRAQA